MENDAVYTENGGNIDIHKHKLDSLEDLIEASNGKPLLVAYWFRHDLERIEKRLQHLKVAFTRLDSSESINQWNASNLPISLIPPLLLVMDSIFKMVGLLSSGLALPGVLNSISRPTPACGDWDKPITQWLYNTSSPKTQSINAY